MSIRKATHNVLSESNAKFILTDEEAQKRADEIRSEIVALSVKRVDIRIEQYDIEAVKKLY